MPSVTGNTPLSDTGVNPGRRSLELDCLRGCAILLVLFHHQVMPYQAAGHLRHVAGVLHRFGWTGVDLFFVLSGFLIGGLLFRELLRDGRLRVGRFLTRRGFKIWPAYFVFLAYIFLQSVRHGSTPAAQWQSLRWNVLQVQNYLGTPLWHTWSLAVEEHFYLALPLLLWLTPQRFLKGFAPAVFMAAVGAACLYLRTTIPPMKDFGGTFATHLRIDSLLFGVMLAWVFHYHRPAVERVRRLRLVVAVLGAALLTPMLFVPPGNPFVTTVGLTMLYLGYGLILLTLVCKPQHADTSRSVPVPLRALAFIGYYSYSIYLWHEHLARYFLAAHGGDTIRRHLPGAAAWLLIIVLYVGLAVGAGVVMFYLIEWPSLLVRNRFAPSDIAPDSDPRIRRGPRGSSRPAAPGFPSQTPATCESRNDEQ